MAVQLLALSDGGASLEFDPDDLDAVRGAIVELFGEPDRRRQAIHTDVGFGGEAFIYQAEWDDPCLIARTSRGREMLERLAERLGAQRAPSSDPLRGPPSPARGEG